MSRDEKLAWVLAGVLVAFVAGSALRELTGWKEAGVGAAIAMPTLVALFGMLWVADDWKAALTAAFAVSFFIFLAGVVALAFLDGDPIPLEGGAATIVKDYLALVGLVVTAYFATQAVEKWAASWQAAKEADANARIAEAHASRASLPPERSRPTRRP